MSVLTFEDRHRGSRVRIWLNELPDDALLPVGTAMRISTFENSSATICRSQVAIEALRSYGASFGYGLLGVEFIPTTDGTTSVAVPVDGSAFERPYPASIARSLDEVTVGCPSEYVDGICACLQSIQAEKRPSGAITIQCMAHGMI